METTREDVTVDPTASQRQRERERTALLDEQLPMEASSNVDGLSAIHAAVRAQDSTSLHRLLREAVVDINTRNKARRAEGRTPLHEAAAVGNTTAMRLLLANGATLNATDEDGQTPLFLAALKGQCAAVEYLTTQDADVNAARANGWLPIHAAAQSGDVDTTEVLLEAGADVLSTTEDNRTVLHIAASSGSSEVVARLVYAGVDVNTVDQEKQTALVVAAANGNRDVVEWLLDHGAVTDAESAGGWLPLHAAAKCGNVEVLELLVSRGTDIHRTTHVGCTALHIAAGFNENDTVVAYLILHGLGVRAVDELGHTPLHYAAKAGAAAPCKTLLQSGAELEARDNDGRTALFAAASIAQYDAAKCLVEYGADVNASDLLGRLPIHAAAHSDSVEIIQLLHSHRANVHGVAADGLTSLLVAAINGADLAVKSLVGYSLDCNATSGYDEDRWSILHHAVEQCEAPTVELLVQHGANIHAVSTRYATPLYVAALKGNADTARILITSGADVNHAIDIMWTPLHAAASSGNEELLELLLESGANLHAIDKDGTTVLHVAAHHGHSAVVESLLRHGADAKAIDPSNGWSTVHDAAFSDDTELLARLIKYGASADAVALDGTRPLHVAIKQRSRRAAEFLVRRGVDVNAVDDKGRTALHFVYQSKGSNFVPLLLSAGAVASIDSPDQDGNRPLHLAALTHCLEEVRALLEAGAAVDVLTNAGKSPLQLAVLTPKSDSAVSTVYALCRFGGEWTDECQARLQKMEVKLKRDQTPPEHPRSQHVRWCQGLRACVLHWEKQCYEGVKELTTIPVEAVQRGEASVKFYLADATSSSSVDLVYRSKICVVGPSEWGKSSLVRSIEAMKPFLMHTQDRTIGIELVSSYFSKSQEIIQLEDADEGSNRRCNLKRHEVTFWDFAGQDVYQVAHALFFSRRTLYVLVVDLDAYTKQLDKVEALRTNRAEAAMDRFLSRHVFRWVRTIFARQPDAEFLVLGTKADLLTDEDVQAGRVWRDLQSRIFQWKLNYKREVEQDFVGSPRHTSNRSSDYDEIKAKLDRLASGDWLVVSVTRRDSIDAVRRLLQAKIEASERGFPMWNKYSSVLRAVNAKREAAKRPSDGKHRIEHSMVLFRTLCRHLMDEIEGLEYDECHEILRTLHDLGDILWYEHEEWGELREFIILDPMLVIDVVREVISHEHANKTRDNQRALDVAPRIDGRVPHDLLMTFPLWKDMDIDLVGAFKLLLQHFQLVYPADDDVMQADSDLIVPSYWKVQLDASSRAKAPVSHEPSRAGGAVPSEAYYCWEYEISTDLCEAVFEQFAVQSYSSFMKRVVRANCIESSCEEFQSWTSLQRGDTKSDVIRVEVAGVNAETVWQNMRFYLMKLEKVLDGYSGMMASRYVVVQSERHALGSAVKAVRDTIMLGRSTSELQASMPWMPPDLEWYVNRSWRDIASFQELQLMQLVRDKLDVVTKLVVTGDSQRRYPALWSLEYRSQQRITVLRMLSDLSGKCFHVPIETHVPPAFLATHGAIIQEGVSLLANVVGSALSVPVLQTAFDGAASYLDSKTQHARKIHSLIERLDFTSASGSVFNMSADSTLSPNGAMAVLRDLLELHNDSLDELSITEISNLECAATAAGGYVWAHKHELLLLRDKLTPCQPRYTHSSSSKASSAVTQRGSSVESVSSDSTKKKDLHFSLCIETVTGLPEWDWYKTYCTWQLLYGERKTPLMTGATSGNTDSNAQPSWRLHNTSLEAVGSVEMLQECRLVVQVKRRSRIGWTKLIGEGEVTLWDLIGDDAKQSFHCEPIRILLQTNRSLAGSSTETKRVIHCEILATK